MNGGFTIDAILILGAGQGSRLKPLTDNSPKPLLSINTKGETIVGRLLSQIRQAFPRAPIFMNFNSLPEVVVEYMARISANLRPELIYERIRLGPTKSVVEFSKLNYEDILVINGDLVLSNTEFTRMSQAIDVPNKAFVVVHRRKKEEARSQVKIDANGFVTSIMELTGTGNHEFGSSYEEEVLSLSGIYKFPTNITRDYIAQYEEPLSPRLIEFWLSQIEVKSFEWVDLRYSIDSLETLTRARMQIEKEL